MGGGLLDLAAKGGQDVYLISNPEITFFKKVYKKHTNFACEYKNYYFENNMDFGVVSKIIIPREADLIKNMFLKIELPRLTSSDGNICSYVNYIGYNIIDYIELYIGSTKINRVTGEWMYIQNELSIKEDKKRGYNEMIGGNSINNYNATNGIKDGTFIVPLNFYFCNEIGMALPYVALQYTDIELRIKLKDFDKLWISENGLEPIGTFKILDFQLAVEYIYLDNNERKSFAQSNHEYLIKQTQYSLNNVILENQNIVKFPINFFHPIIEIIFVIQNKNKLLTKENGGKDYFNYSLTDDEPFADTIKTAKLKFNGIDRTVDMTAKELRLYNAFQRHTSIPNNYIYLYSFSLHPESFQPSGSCNFSRFDSVELELVLANNIKHSDFRIFGVNYNVLRISKGLAGLAFIN